MKNLAHTTLAAGLLAFMQACATGSNKPDVDPSVPVELHETKWRLVAISGALDGRVIAFKRAGKDGYLGTLAEPGRRLSSVVGVEAGRDIFKIRRKGLNEYEGTYMDINAAGTFSEREVVVFVKGNSLTWNQESAIWERIE